ncbi:MAG: SGNH/GDSL hydrolase family protein [Sphaerochaetaceae bacterium]|jgi:lysophospholipase L1-like esterase|nr:SGNH/GDSL hydrolase family protein [Sphaerochaetaceae bacterium]MDD2405366.1 SGNH/GDSL hydrolase family protein [Sphaerochaetaceae bacterium]MDD3670559.1 SGNH/GDSL hydrolase family protein [Sphaerochaetaceae bacterium]MDD4259915.1 SGNH/GDSL hydrolase family protein [Sphaerochaetaceae bacterium]MDD4762438.1 SGNH/GDSL hydrolase family protein [Sphaerochaetaceae bacterium]
MKTTLIYGDSLSSGRYGIAYTAYLPVQKEIHGIDGDNLGGIMARAISRIRRGNLTAGTVVIQGGANDILLPYVSRSDASWRLATTKLGTLSHTPIDDVNRFISRFSKQLNELVEHIKNSNILICSITVLGERLDSTLNQTRNMFNAAMKEVTLEYGARWCDVSTPLEHIIRQNQSSGYLVPTLSSLEEDAMYVGSDELRSSLLSESRNLVVTVDGIHPNLLGAKTIAETLTVHLHW